MRTTFKAIEKDAVFFITSSVTEFIPIFTDASFCKIITSALSFYRKNNKLKMYSYVIMDNHFHAVLSADNISILMRDLKKYTAKKIILEIERRNKSWIINQFQFWKQRHKNKSKYQIWQEGYHPEQILNKVMMLQKMEYIHNNPVRRGLVAKAEDWWFSSARNYAGLDFEMEIDMI